MHGLSFSGVPGVAHTCAHTYALCSFSLFGNGLHLRCRCCNATVDCTSWKRLSTSSGQPFTDFCKVPGKCQSQTPLCILGSVDRKRLAISKRRTYVTALGAGSLWRGSLTADTMMANPLCRECVPQQWDAGYNGHHQAEPDLPLPLQAAGCLSVPGELGP